MKNFYKKILVILLLALFTQTAWASISDTTKTDLNFKFNQLKQFSTTAKQFFEEGGNRFTQTDHEQVWLATLGSVPATEETKGLVTCVTDLTMTEDTSVSLNKSWTTGIRRWVPPFYGNSWSVRVYEDNAGSKGTEILTTDAIDWFFDYSEGRFTAQDSVAGKSQPLHIQGCYYTGALLSRLTIATTTDPLMINYFVATSTTATSTLGFGLKIEAGNLQISDLISCDTVDTTSDGTLICGTDSTGGGGGSFAWTPTSNFDQTANATTTQLWLQGSPISLSASSTAVFDNATTTLLGLNGQTFSDLVGTGLQLTSGVLNTTLGTTIDISTETNLTAGTGITLSNDDLSIDTSQNISVLSNLTSNGFVKTSGGVGTLSVDTSTYLTTVDISADTNLAVSSPIILSGDTLSMGTVAVGNGGTGQTSFGQGWLNSDGATLTSSTSPTFNYLTATSSTATSTLPKLESTTILIGTTTASSGAFSTGETGIEIASQSFAFDTILAGDSIFIRDYRSSGSGGWARAVMGIEDKSGTDYWALGGFGASGQSSTYGYIGQGYNSAALKWNSSNQVGVNLSSTYSPALDLAIGDANTGLEQTASDTLHIYTGGVSRLTAGSAGNVGISSTTPGTILSVGMTGGINISDTATSTFGNGIDIKTGCFSINEVCVGGGGGGGSATVLSAPFYITSPATSDNFPVTFIPTNSTISKIWAETDTGTVDLNIEWRAAGSAGSAGTDTMASDLQATASGVTQTSFSDDTIPAGSWLAYTSSASAGNPTKLWISIQYTRD